jgi:hypothetical protein
MSKVRGERKHGSQIVRRFILPEGNGNSAT